MVGKISSIKKRHESSNYIKEEPRGRQINFHGELVCLCCGGECCILFLRQYWSVPSRYSDDLSELNAMADEDDVVYEQIDKQNNTLRETIGGQKTNKENDCTVVQETIGGQKMNEHDNCCTVVRERSMDKGPIKTMIVPYVACGTTVERKHMRDQSVRVTHLKTFPTLFYLFLKQREQ
ncbi:unnamed protein product [Litomosoides sigmodontis]|uniref:Uncharacterized protein n=1 Tax=Litomosoides sigmodontis TaxID=42156 RepID=A0A3P6TBN7_LITSI|nr:unnamed protein product [Litomosoides sigmodontis]